MQMLFLFFSGKIYMRLLISAIQFLYLIAVQYLIPDLNIIECDRIQCIPTVDPKIHLKIIRIHHIGNDIAFTDISACYIQRSQHAAFAASLSGTIHRKRNVIPHSRVDRIGRGISRPYLERIRCLPAFLTYDRRHGSTVRLLPQP